jgi:hypothetical protein
MSLLCQILPVHTIHMYHSFSLGNETLLTYTLCVEE